MKRWFTGMVVVCAAVLLLAGAAVAQMNPGPFHILHKYGQVYDSASGTFDLSGKVVALSPDGWAVDFVYNSQGASILHRYGGVWTTSSGWDLSAHFAGIDYARALEYLRDLTGCWGLQITEFETHYDGTVTAYVLDRDMAEYPLAYILVEWQTGTRFGGTIVYYEGEEEGCDEIPFEGTIIGDHFTAVAHNTESYDDTTCEVLDIITGLVFWNDDDERWELKGFYGGADLECNTGGEAGFFGAFIAWPETSCVCPPAP
jgi:hypothetical protein